VGGGCWCVVRPTRLRSHGQFLPAFDVRSYTVEVRLYTICRKVAPLLLDKSFSFVTIHLLGVLTQVFFGFRFGAVFCLWGVVCDCWELGCLMAGGLLTSFRLIVCV
jgi:hypothetical protein